MSEFVIERDMPVFVVEQEQGHYVIGHDSEPGMITTIECNVGPIHLNQNQVLTLADAKRLIDAFCEDLPWPEEYRLVDVTGRFL